MADKNDVFVGNVTFNTTEEQLRDIFSFVGPIKNIRILQDKDTGRPKGFAFIEYFDANTALAAIRRLDQTELNGRKLRVSYSNNSNLKDLARQIGQDVSEQAPMQTRSEFSAVANLQLHEAWELLDSIKTMIEEDKGVKIRALLDAYPAFGVAVQQLQRRLGLLVLPAADTPDVAAGLPSMNAQIAAPTAPMLAPTLSGLPTLPTLGQAITAYNYTGQGHPQPQAQSSDSYDTFSHMGDSFNDRGNNMYEGQMGMDTATYGRGYRDRGYAQR